MSKSSGRKAAARKARKPGPAPGLPVSSDFGIGAWPRHWTRDGSLQPQGTRRQPARRTARRNG